MSLIISNAAKAQMAVKMYDARDAIIGLIGKERFFARVDEFKPIFEQVCAAKGTSQLQAAILLMKSAEPDEIPIVLAMCAEIIEPSTRSRLG